MSGERLWTHHRVPLLPRLSRYGYHLPTCTYDPCSPTPTLIELLIFCRGSFLSWSPVLLEQMVHQERTGVSHEHLLLRLFGQWSLWQSHRSRNPEWPGRSARHGSLAMVICRLNCRLGMHELTFQQDNRRQHYCRRGIVHHGLPARLSSHLESSLP